ncbi:MAG TPA: hypothetical protein PLK31_24400, partial [Chloroflexota bacterium]|nr:hypothetical protein [Chloroflexota bacterium]
RQTTSEGVMPVTPPLPAGAYYTWTVQAQDANGEVIGEVHSFFSVKGGLTAVWPPNGESVDNQPILQWEPYPGVTMYHVVVIDDDAYPPVVIADEETKETIFAVSTLLEAGSYSWTVWAKDANGAVIAEANNQFVVEK